MADIGEAIGLAGINQPQPVIDDFAAGFSVGDRMAARKNEKEQKRYDIIRQSTRMKPGAFFSNTLSQKAQQAVVDHNYRIRQGLEKYGQKYLYTPEAQQSMQETDFVVNNLKAEDDRVKNWYSDVQAGKIVDDPEFRAAHMSGDWNKLTGYRNQNLGFAVDPNTGISNVRGIRKYELNKDYAPYLANNDFYTQKGERHKLLGGEGFFEYNIPKEGIAAIADELSRDPERINFIVATRGPEIASRVEALRQQAIASGDQTFDQTQAVRVAAKDIIAQDVAASAKPRAIKERYSISEGGSGQDTDSGVGDVVSGSFNVEVPTYRDRKVDKQGNKIPDKQGEVVTIATDYSFQTKPTAALVAATSNTFDFNGNRISDPEVRNAEYGQFAIVPVYKNATGVASGKDITGRIVPPSDIEKAEKAGKMQYLPVAIGTYQKKSKSGELEQVSIYRPVTEIEGAVTSSGSAAYKKAMRERLGEIKQVAARKNGAVKSGPKTLTGKINPAELQSGSLYSVNGKTYKWNGSKLIPQ